MKRKSRLMATDRSELHPDRELPPRVQGEGDYEAARRFRKSAEEFVKSHDIEREARRAAPTSEHDAREMRRAEAAGRSRARTADYASTDAASIPIPDRERR